MSQVKLDQVITPGKTSSEPKAEESTALVAIDTVGLNADSLEILNQIIVAEDRNKTKDLTQLFIDNQNKKTMVRLDSLSNLQDKLVGLLAKRVTERPDEISNQELMQAAKIVQDLIDRSTKTVTDPMEKPLIQINQQDNSVNVGSDTTNYTRESRDRVRNAVMSLLSSINDATAQTDVVDASNKDEVVELQDNENDD